MADTSAFRITLRSVRRGTRVRKWSKMRDNAAGRIPAPVKLGGRTLWRRKELLRWVKAGCPDRGAWDALEKGKVVTTRQV